MNKMQPSTKGGALLLISSTIWPLATAYGLIPSDTAVLWQSFAGAVIGAWAVWRNEKM